MSEANSEFGKLCQQATTLLDNTKFKRKMRANIMHETYPYILVGYQDKHVNHKVNFSVEHCTNLRLFKYLTRMVKIVDPDFTFTSIIINKNVVCSKHKDKNNTGLSYIIGLGNYTGGETVVEGEMWDIRNKFLKFDGTNREHWSLPFEGTRYSCVYYTNEEVQKWLDKENMSAF